MIKILIKEEIRWKSFLNLSLNNNYERNIDTVYNMLSWLTINKWLQSLGNI